MANNIYQKLQKARVEFQSLKIEKSGVNKFAGYKYFELSDILPKINKIFDKMGLCGIVSFNRTTATLTLYDTEKPDEKIVITSPMERAKLKGCHPIQNLGAVETYQRRYLYMTVMEIVEPDVLDATTGSVKPTRSYKGRPEKAVAKGAIEKEIKSKYDKIKCAFCGETHGEKGDPIVLVDGRWGAKSCFLKKAEKPDVKEKIAKVIDETIKETAPPPSDKDSFPF